MTYFQSILFSLFPKEVSFQPATKKLRKQTRNKQNKTHAQHMIPQNFIWEKNDNYHKCGYSDVLWSHLSPIQAVVHLQDTAPSSLSTHVDSCSHSPLFSKHLRTPAVKNYIMVIVKIWDVWFTCTALLFLHEISD